MESKVKMLKGFYPLLDNRQLEFLTSVDEIMSCELCNTISKSYFVGKCRHFFCSDCYYLIKKETFPKCPLDDDDWKLKTSCCLPEDSLSRSRVRCPNSAYGCKFGDSLSRVNDHVGRCQFYPLPCIKCGDTVGHNNLLSHRRRSCGFRHTKTADPKPAVLDTVQ
ncbi:TNF receptor-associated factor 5-like [Ixodes scapularis]|uniref:TNF receptor-associated factor 5-like n=1 Tax=Ixodes scapularis TaxID=6945 RepID=UPI001AD69246|nr:TNF receptor-associated factor 5-like [Ixodes scapularis]